MLHLNQEMEIVESYHNSGNDTVYVHTTMPGGITPGMSLSEIKGYSDPSRTDLAFSKKN